MEQLTNLFDELHLSHEKGILKVMEHDGFSFLLKTVIYMIFHKFRNNMNKNVKIQIYVEKIMLSCSVFKFNRKNKRQERNIMITTKAIYNLSKTSIYIYRIYIHLYIYIHEILVFLMKI